MNDILDAGTKKIVIIFIKTLSIYSILSVFFYCYEGLIDHHGAYYSPFLDAYSLVELILTLLKYPIVGILKILGYDVVVNGPMIHLLHGKGIVIYTPCLGIKIMIGYVSLILGYEGKSKMLFLILGLFVIHLLNIARMLFILLTIEKFPAVVSVSHDIFTYLSYILIILLYYSWVKKYSISNSPL